MKFSIRDLFLVTMIVAVCVAWWVDRSRLTGAKSEAESDARYLSRIYHPDNPPFVRDSAKEAGLYRKYHSNSQNPPKPVRPLGESGEGPVMDELVPITSAPAHNPSKP